MSTAFYFCGTANWGEPNTIDIYNETIDEHTKRAQSSVISMASFQFVHIKFPIREVLLMHKGRLSILLVKLKQCRL